MGFPESGWGFGGWKARTAKGLFSSGSVGGADCSGSILGVSATTSVIGGTGESLTAAVVGTGKALTGVGTSGREDVMPKWDRACPISPSKFFRANSRSLVALIWLLLLSLSDSSSKKVPAPMLKKVIGEGALPLGKCSHPVGCATLDRLELAPGCA